VGAVNRLAVARQNIGDHSSFLAAMAIFIERGPDVAGAVITMVSRHIAAFISSAN